MSKELKDKFVKELCVTAFGVTTVSELDPEIVWQWIEQNILNQSEWISVQDQNFPKGEWILLMTSDKACHVAYYSSDYKKWVANSNFGGKPEYWQPLPEPPKQID